MQQWKGFIWFLFTKMVNLHGISIGVAVKLNRIGSPKKKCDKFDAAHFEATFSTMKICLKNLM